LTWKDLKRFISDNNYNNEQKEEEQEENCNNQQNVLEYSEIFHSGYQTLNTIRKPILKITENIVLIISSVCLRRME
jgi:hypothetical protein